MDNRVSHAQLFHGPEGSGKLALAIAYAQFINCRDRQFFREATLPADSCGACPSCIKYQKLIHPDLHFIFPVATNKDVKKDPVSDKFLDIWRTILLQNDFRLSLNDWHKALDIEKKQGIINADDCSMILRKLSYKSYESEFKVMIIWRVERLYHAAAPKILKILEEPPDKTLFLLITGDPDQIIPTILSRTQMVKVPKLRDEDMMALLTSRHNLSSGQAARIIPLADGNYDEALELLPGLESEEGEFELFQQWMRYCVSANHKEMLAHIGRLSKNNREWLIGFLAYAERMIRSAMLINSGVPRIPRLTETEREWLDDFRPFVNRDTLETFVSELEKGQSQVERNVNPAIMLTDISLIFGRLLQAQRQKKKAQSK